MKTDMLELCIIQVDAISLKGHSARSCANSRRLLSEDLAQKMGPK